MIGTTVGSSFGQFIRNGDMEIGTTGLSSVPDDWTIVSGTPDYCSVNSGCWQLTYVLPVPSPQGGRWVRFFRAYNYNEVFGQFISSPLMAGHHYTLTFHCTYSRGSAGVTSCPTSVVVGFSIGQPLIGVGELMNDTAYLEQEEIWVRHLYSFIAQDNYDFIYFGTIENLTFPCSDVSYVDDVQLLETGLEMPNVFTPNHDGVNDRFVPINAVGLSDVRLTIYDRWGTTVFQGWDVQSGWDGRNNGSACSSGLYFWTVQSFVKGSAQFLWSGSVTLLE